MSDGCDWLVAPSGMNEGGQDMNFFKTIRIGSQMMAIGTIAIAAMRQVGYSKEFSAGIIAYAGTLGILIPPSIVMVVYATATNVSVGRMFLAGILPGLMAGAMLMIAIYIVARRRNLPSEPWRGFGEIMAAGKEAGWGLFLIFIIIGGIYGGAFTPTEAASVAAVYSVLIALFVYRDMGPLKGMPWIPAESTSRTTVGFKASVYALAIFAVWMISSFFFLGGLDTTTRMQIGLLLAALVLLGYPFLRGQANPLTFIAGLPVWGYNLALIARRFVPALFHGDTNKAMVDSAKTTVMLMFIIVNAMLFAHTLTAERIPQTITEWMLGAGFNWFTFLIAVNVLLLIGGQFMEPSGLLLIVAPVVFPIAMELGIDPIHLGIIMVVNMEIGMVTPPIGLNLFVTSGITGMSLAQVVKAALPFVVVLLIFLVIVTYVPVLSTLVPYALMGPEIILSR